MYLNIVFTYNQYSSIAFADVDNDNDQDVLITGIISSVGQIFNLYTNDGSGIFTEMTGTPFDGVYYGSIAFADVDNDNDQDVLITGATSLSQRTSKLYRNTTPVPNQPPGEIAGDVNGNGIIDEDEITGDINGDGEIGEGELIGDLNGDGSINNGEIEGDKNGDGEIGEGETLILGLFKHNLEIYPNPSKDFIYVQSLEVLKVEIVDMKGRVLIKSTTKKPIDIRSLSNGIYLIYISKNSDVVSKQRFIKI